VGLAVLLLSAALLSAQEKASVQKWRLSKADIEKVADYYFELVLPVFMAKLQTSTEGKALLAGSSCATTETASAGCAAHGASCSANCGASTAQVSRCAEYGACSLYGDLTGASGDVLDMYVREKASDGETYDERSIPAFEASTLSGEAVRSTDLVGKPTVLVTLAGHCSHSYQTLPILQELEKTYGPKGFEVVGVYVNSGSVEDINSWIDYYKPEYDVWVSPTDGLGDVVNSHLVPTYLLVDEDGKVKEKLVGFKTQEEVEARLRNVSSTLRQPHVEFSESLLRSRAPFLVG
jgi:thiol-disulfide isomerase/thioredoxin